MTVYCDSLRIIGDQVKAACQQYQRDCAAVDILAVSKKHPATAIEAMAACGQTKFGENYVQEMQEKALALQHLNLEWHFIGPIQSNKTKIIAELASWVHSVDRCKIAERLHTQRPDNAEPLNICLQVNISREASKSGVMVDELESLVSCVTQLDRLRLRGIMVIPAAESDVLKQRQAFAEAKACFDHINATYLSPDCAMDTLSMGMSGDLEAAVAEGSTLVRIGTALFGQRAV